MATTTAAWPLRIPYERGVWSWVTTTDHKRIGILYMLTATAYFVAAIVMAMLMRTQLIVPNNTLRFCRHHPVQDGGSAAR